MKERYERGHYDAVIERFGAQSGLYASPEAHSLCMLALRYQGEMQRAELHYWFSKACEVGILASGDGTRARPLRVLQVADEYWTLRGLERAWVKRESIEVEGRFLDIFMFEDGDELCFDVTEMRTRLAQLWPKE